MRKSREKRCLSISPKRIERDKKDNVLLGRQECVCSVQGSAFPLTRGLVRSWCGTVMDSLCDFS